jgi:predicted nucleic acid-binding protein
VIVIDASVLATALGDDGDAARKRLRGQELAAPEIVDLEVTSVWRRKLTDERRAALALTDLAELPLTRAPHRPLLPRCWQLRHNLTPCDAAYVALAEVLDVALVTADRRLARATGIRCAMNAAGVARACRQRRPGRGGPAAHRSDDSLTHGTRWPASSAHP